MCVPRFPACFFQLRLYFLWLSLIVLCLHDSLMFFLILFSFLFVGILRAFYWKYTKLLLIAPFQYRYASQYLRQDNAFTERVNWLSFIILFINFSLLLLFNKQILLFENHLFFIEVEK